jgi:MFS superfamily sulfate permease-like transporter
VKSKGIIDCLALQALKYEENNWNMNSLKVTRKTFFGDLVAGLVMALVSIPGGLGQGLLAGVNPVFGLYSMIAGTPVATILDSLYKEKIKPSEIDKR